MYNDLITWLLTVKAEIPWSDERIDTENPQPLVTTYVEDCDFITYCCCSLSCNKIHISPSQLWKKKWSFYGSKNSQKCTQHFLNFFKYSNLIGLSFFLFCEFQESKWGNDLHAWNKKHENSGGHLWTHLPLLSCPVCVWIACEEKLLQAHLFLYPKS